LTALRRTDNVQRMPRPGLLLPILVLLLIRAAAGAEIVSVTITATVPKDTPRDAKVFLAGSLDAVGAWKPDGVEMTRLDDGRYRAHLKLPKGQTLEYKLNRGSWETVEKGAGGAEIENRTIDATGDRSVDITVVSWRSTAAEAPATSRVSTITGDVRTHDHFRSQRLGNERKLLVWLPPGYETDANNRYPVLYLHDGQNVFDAATSFAGEWRADEAATRLIEQHKIEPIIIVAIENAGAARIAEYTPTADATCGAGAGGKGEAYAKFLIEEVKPFVDRTYRTQGDRDHTAVGGSSLGGLISLYLVFQHGDVFSKAAVMSPSLWWDDHNLVRAIEANPAPLRRAKLWIDMGTREGAGDDPARNVADARHLASVLREAGISEGRDFQLSIVEGASHNETAWASRFDQVLVFLFGK
jgi:predicted alpha/beta superfamily hydrolase